MSNAFRGQAQYMTPIYSQAPTGGLNMSGYGGDTMQDLGDLGDLSGLANFGAVSGPASMGGGYSMFGSYSPTPYQQQDYTGGYMPGYGAQLPQQFGGYGGGYGRGYGGFASQFGGRFGGGYGGGFGVPQPQQPNVNDLFGQYMFGQYYGQPAFNPFQATSMFGGGRRGGFGGGRRGGRERMFPSQPPSVQQPQPPYVRAQPYQPTNTVMPDVQSPPVPPTAPAPTPASSSSRDLFYQDMINSGLSADAALQETNKRYGGGTVAAAAQQTPATALPLTTYKGSGWINYGASPLSKLSADAELQEANRRYGDGAVAAAAQQTPTMTTPSIDWISEPPQAPTVQPVDTTMPYDLGELSGLSRLGGFDPYGRFGAFNFR